jgi:hypothetical protein
VRQQVRFAIDAPAGLKDAEAQGRTGGAVVPNSTASSISERELWACAYKIIDMHGSGAELHAAMRADELLADGNVDGQRVWKAILARIEEWRRESLPPMRQ